MDKKLQDVAKFVIQNKQCSVSAIQRNFGFGFNRTKTIVNQLNDLGIVGKFKGGAPREVLVDDLTDVDFD